MFFHAKLIYLLLGVIKTTNSDCDHANFLGNVYCVLIKAFLSYFVVAIEWTESLGSLDVRS